MTAFSYQAPLFASVHWRSCSTSSSIDTESSPRMTIAGESPLERRKRARAMAGVGIKTPAASSAAASPTPRPGATTKEAAVTRKASAATVYQAGQSGSATIDWPSTPGYHSAMPAFMLRNRRSGSARCGRSRGAAANTLRARAREPAENGHGDRREDRADDEEVRREQQRSPDGGANGLHQGQLVVGQPAGLQRGPDDGEEGPGEEDEPEIQCEPSTGHRFTKHHTLLSAEGRWTVSRLSCGEQGRCQLTADS